LSGCNFVVSYRRKKNPDPDYISSRCKTEWKSIIECVTNGNYSSSVFPEPQLDTNQQIPRELYVYFKQTLHFSLLWTKAQYNLSFPCAFISSCPHCHHKLVLPYLLISLDLTFNFSGVYQGNHYCSYSKLAVSTNIRA